MEASPQFSSINKTSRPNPDGKIGGMIRRESGPKINTRETVGRMGPTRMPASYGKKGK